VTEVQDLAILIVDDRPENLSSMEQLLVQDGLRILTAESGNEALGLMLENDLALVLLDVQMPGMDGFEVAELMRRNERTRRIPIIFVTAINKERRHIFSGFEAGAVDYMFKPVDSFIMRSKVQVFLEIKRHELRRERMLAELDAANKRLREISERKSDFLSAASHELRTPLTVIKEYCSLLYDEVAGPLNEDQSKFMESALRNCNRLAELVNDLLDLDSIESGQLEFRRTSVDVNQILAEVYEDFRARCEAKGQKLVLEPAPDLPAVLGDHQKLTQVLVNLVGNAHKFMEGEGTITLRTYVQEDQVRVEVEDTGPGIPELDQKRVFERFTQLSRKECPGAQGTGLGLAISHKIIELLGGQLDLVSEQGRGALFFFNMPLFTLNRQVSAMVTDHIKPRNSGTADWSLMFLKPGGDSPDLPEWFGSVLEDLVRAGEDLVAEFELEGMEVKTVLLNTDRSGAFSFLARLDQATAGKAEQSLRLQYSLLEIDPEQRNRFEWDPERLVFSELAMNGESKGLTNV
jgi:signal transduction histidine kinase